MKALKRKRCAYCGCWFNPNARTAKQQKSCGQPSCRRARQRQKQRRWRALNPDYERSRKAKRRVWAIGFPSYYQRYRAAHPEYVARDNVRRVRARRRVKLSANVTAMRQIVVEKAGRLGTSAGPELSANVTALHRRVVALEDCLRSTVSVVIAAKRTGMAASAAGVR